MRQEEAAGRAGGRRWAWLSGAGLTLLGFLKRRQAPQRKMAVYLHSARLGQWADACPRARPAARSAEAVPKMAAARGGVAGAVQ